MGRKIYLLLLLGLGLGLVSTRDGAHRDVPARQVTPDPDLTEPEPLQDLISVRSFTNLGDCGANHLTCYDGLTCCPDPETYTCCKMATATTGVGCCPLPNATCCEDEASCCPDQFVCTERRHCAYLKPANITGSPISDPPTLVTGSSLPATTTTPKP